LIPVGGDLEMVHNWVKRWEVLWVSAHVTIKGWEWEMEEARALN
jgi:hypothetical protein